MVMLSTGTAGSCVAGHGLRHFGAMADDLYDALQKLMKDPASLPPPPIATLVGFRLTALAPGRATMELDADERLANPLGTLHGGALCDVADAAMGMAYAAALERGESFTTLELKI